MTRACAQHFRISSVIYYFNQIHFCQKEALGKMPTEMGEVGLSLRRKGGKEIFIHFFFFTFNLTSRYDWCFQCIVSCFLFGLLTKFYKSLSSQLHCIQMQYFLLNWVNKPKTHKGLFMACVFCCGVVLFFKKVQQSFKDHVVLICQLTAMLFLPLQSAACLLTLQDVIILRKLFWFCILSADPNIKTVIFPKYLATCALTPHWSVTVVCQKKKKKPCG